MTTVMCRFNLSKVAQCQGPSNLGTEGHDVMVEIKRGNLPSRLLLEMFFPPTLTLGGVE